MKKKVICTVPLKSLSSERFQDWVERYPNKQIVMLTGDTLFNEKERSRQMAIAAKSDIIIMTSELLDSVTRKAKDEQYQFLTEVGLIVIDEAHLLTMEGRGPVVEAALMRFTKINPDARICFLSATMVNLDQLGDWLTKLNGKETKTINCSWRPVKLEMDYPEHPTPRNRFGRIDYSATQEAKENMAVELIMSKPDEKFLCFVHAKNTGRNIIGKLKNQGEISYFHNADLELNERREIEESFKNRQEGIRVLISTSTTAIGSVAKGTLITSANGVQIQVENLHIGSSVLSYNISKNKFEQDAITNTEKYQALKEFEIELSDGTKIISDWKHPFYVRTSSGLITKIAQDLTEEDDIVLKHEL